MAQNGKHIASRGGSPPLKMAKHADFKMYPRAWSKKAQPITTKSKATVGRFTVVTYNILTDFCMPADQYLYCPEHCRSQGRRHPRIMEEVRTMDSDIVCFQEVDSNHFERRLKPDMSRLGYKGIVFVPENNQGLAVFYRNSTFILKEKKHHIVHELAERHIQSAKIGSSLKDTIRRSIARPVATVMVKLQHVTTGDVISVANLHVSWDGLIHPALQALQVSLTLNELVRFAGGADKPHLICGDFNTPPDFPAYSMMKNGRMGPDAKAVMKKMAAELDQEHHLLTNELVQHIPAAFQLSSDLKSAYKEVLGNEPAVTNCDDCGLPERTNLCLDYFWFSHHSLEVSAVLETPPAEAIMRHYAMPSVLFPSDHLPIQAEFVFKH